MVNHKKLLQSKWTAISPKNQEKHFIVVKIIKENQDSQKVFKIILEAVLTKNRYKIIPADLNDQDQWQTGWN